MIIPYDINIKAGRWTNNKQTDTENTNFVHNLTAQVASLFPILF